MAALDSVQGGVERLTQTLGRVNKLQLDLALQGYYLQDREDSHGAFPIDIDPQSGRLYRVAVVDDPAGRRRTKTQTITTTAPTEPSRPRSSERDGGGQHHGVGALRLPGRRALPALGGARRVALRRAGGLPADERVNLSLEAFDFGRGPKPRTCG